jgi:hypothetical protein
MRLSMRKQGVKPKGGRHDWYLRVSDRGAVLFVPCVDAEGLEDVWNSAL